MREENSLRVECLPRLLLATDVLIALIMSFWILKSSKTAVRGLMGALSMNVAMSNDTLYLMTHRGSAFYTFFSSHCFLNSLWSTSLSCLASAQLLGSAPSGDGSGEACDCLGRNGRRPFPSSPLLHTPTCSSPITFLAFHLYLLLLLLLTRGYMVQRVPSVTPSPHRFSPPLTSLPLPRFSRPLPH